MFAMARYCMMNYVSTQSEDGKWNKYGGRLAWDKSVICCNNPAFGGTGNAKTGEDYVAAPNIDHTQVCALQMHFSAPLPL
jgi:hypothetical protein